jgi:hypothetical protein
MRKLGEREAPNYELKSKVLNSELGEFYLSLDKQVKSIQYNAAYHPESVSQDELRMSYRAQEVLLKSPFFREAHKLNSASRQRVKRLRGRVEDVILNGNAIFLTLTFTDEVLEKTSPETRRKYVTRFLKSQCAFYVANLDCGSQNHREHYHAIVQPNGEKIDLAAWEYGAINSKRVHASEQAPLRLSKYVAKISNHALKDTAKCSRLIYSRQV